MEIEKILSDLSSRLKVDIDSEKIEYFTEGASAATVFGIGNKYLVKTVDENTLKSQTEFLEFYKDIPNLQKTLFYNSDLSYICFKYIEGEKFRLHPELTSNDLLRDVCEIIGQYRKYPYEGYGFLGDDHLEWSEFLKSEVEYASKYIKEFDIPKDKIKAALSDIKRYDVPQYLVHGDFGTHNFLVKDRQINVIDPMPVVGDYLFDFYHALFSNAKIIDDLKIGNISKFYDRDAQYKRDLMIIVLYIRMCRSYVYNAKDFDFYKDAYNEFELGGEEKYGKVKRMELGDCER